MHFFIKRKKRKKCVLCGKCFKNSEMSEEHYAAINTCKEDIVVLNFPEMIDLIIFEELIRYITKLEKNEESITNITGNYFDDELLYSKHSNRRTARILCRDRNTFLERYDKPYKKSFQLQSVSV